MSFMFMSVPGISPRGAVSSTSTSTITCSISPLLSFSSTSERRVVSFSFSSGGSSGSLGLLPRRMSRGLVFFLMGLMMRSANRSSAFFSAR